MTTMLPTTARPGRSREHAELCGRVAHVRWWDEESGGIIADLRDGSTVKGTCDGHALDVGVGYRFYGWWREDARYGRQFTFETYTMDEPADRRGVTRYLAEFCRGVGPATAGKLWDKYGAEAITVLRTDSKRVAKDGLMGHVDARDAAADLERNHAFERARVELHGLLGGKGFGQVAIKACIAKFGANAGELVRRNPWLLMLREIPGAGFKRVDRVYLENGGNPARLKRQMLAGWDALREGIDGNTWHPLGAFASGIVRCVSHADIVPERALALGTRAKWLRVRTGHGAGEWVGEADKVSNEAEVAICAKRLLAAQVAPWPDVSPPTVSKHQCVTWGEVRHSPLCILAGTPGTGKTYLAAAALKEVVAAQRPGAVAVCAPTGKAAVRITEAMARYGLPLEATTIHRLLEITRNGHDGKGWGFAHDETNPLTHRFIAIDEVSMLDTDLAASLFRAIPPGTHVLLIGDVNQLPPVGHGAPLRDLIAAGVPTATLTEIQRNSGAIVRACAAIQAGRRFDAVDKIDIAAGDNLKMLECGNEDAQLDMLGSVVRKYIAKPDFDAAWDLQVLTPLNEKSRIARVPLNTLLQGILNPLPTDAADYSVGEFRRGDKIICLRNCFLKMMELADDGVRESVAGYREALDPTWNKYEVFLANGDLGRVEACDSARNVIVARFTCPTRIVKIPLGKKDATDNQDGGGAASDFALAYAITIHKSQGSEWPVVIVMIDQAAGPVACRELIYTAISRAKSLCLLIGKRAVVDFQCSKVSLVKRKTFLRELLAGEGREDESRNGVELRRRPDSVAGHRNEISNSRQVDP